MLITEEQLVELDLFSKISDIDAIVIMKHSTRCSISSMALSRLERSWSSPDKKVPVYLLDILKYRHLSDKLSKMYSIQHESPQVLVIKNGKCIYSSSHSDISAQEIRSFISNS